MRDMSSGESSHRGAPRQRDDPPCVAAAKPAWPPQRCDGGGPSFHQQGPVVADVPVSSFMSPPSPLRSVHFNDRERGRQLPFLV